MKRSHFFMRAGLLLAAVWLMSPGIAIGQENANDRQKDLQANDPSDARQEQRDRQGQQTADDDETEYRGMEHAALGVLLSERPGKGVRIRDILEDGPADEAGLERGDRITRIDDKPMKSYSDVIRYMNKVRPGQTAQITVDRDGAEKTLKVTFQSREQTFPNEDYSFSKNRQRGEPSGQNYRQGRNDYRQDRFGRQEEYGRRTSRNEDQVAERRWSYRGRQDHGVLGLDLGNQRGAITIRDVWPGSPADQAGLRHGDTIVSINDQRVRDPEDLTDELEDRRPGERVDLTIERDGRHRDVRVRLTSAENLQQARRDREGDRDRNDRLRDDDRDNNHRRNDGSRQNDNNDRQNNDRQNEER